MSWSFSSLFTFGGDASPKSTEIPVIFPMSVPQDAFVKTDVVAIYSKILTDALDRTHGLTDEETALFWDNCVMSSSSDGLITLLAKAMSEKGELFLVYVPALKVVRKATPEEQAQIIVDYRAQGESSIGIYVSFKNYSRSDMVRLYIALEYCTVASLFKSMNLAKAIQLKFGDLRATTSLTDKAEGEAQAFAVAVALSQGKDVMLDAKDLIETSKPDLTAAKASVEFIAQKEGFYLGMPASYLTGIQTTGMGSTGEQDTKAVERGLRGYFLSILKPLCFALFKKNVEYVSQDFRNLASSMEALKTLDLVSEDLVSKVNKTLIVNKLLELPDDAKGDAPVRVTLAPPAAVPPLAAAARAGAPG